MMDEKDWRPAETAPKDGTKVLALLPNGDIVVVWFEHGCWNLESCSRSRIAAWMPAPERNDSSERKVTRQELEAVVIEYVRALDEVARANECVAVLAARRRRARARARLKSVGRRLV